SGKASALWLFHHCCHHCCLHPSCYTFTLRCKPYNAFSPYCAGSVCCDGCCPVNFPQPPGPCHGIEGACGPDLGSCEGGACTGRLPAAGTPSEVPALTAPSGPAAPTYQPPAPTPAAPAGATSLPDGLPPV